MSIASFRVLNSDCTVHWDEVWRLLQLSIPGLCLPSTTPKLSKSLWTSSRQYSFLSSSISVTLFDIHSLAILSTGPNHHILKDFIIPTMFSFPIRAYACFCVGYIESLAAVKKSLVLVWRWQQLLDGFLTKGHLFRVSRQSADDKDDNGIILGSVHRSHSICPTTGKPRKTSARMPSNKGCAASHRLKWDPLPPNQDGRIPKHIRKGEEGKEEMTGQGKAAPLLKLIPCLMKILCSYIVNT